ncbi:hypothetical protein DOY81_012183 [Sarcophaga bullata]|nr:hypothetical protein DOY81_012183 [Sarcophaga bullata]
MKPIVSTPSNTNHIGVKGFNAYWCTKLCLSLWFTTALPRERLSGGLGSGGTGDTISVCSGVSGTGAIIHENNHHQGNSTASSNSPV